MVRLRPRVAASWGKRARRPRRLPPGGREGTAARARFPDGPMTAQFPSTVGASSGAHPSSDRRASLCLEQAIRAVRDAARGSNAPYAPPDVGPRIVRPGLGYVGWSFWGDRAARWLLIRVRGDVAVLTLKETRACRATFVLEFAPPFAEQDVLAGAWNWLLPPDGADP